MRRLLEKKPTRSAGHVRNLLQLTDLVNEKRFVVNSPARSGVLERYITLYRRCDIR